ncbi:tripartite tricarboxylate transporter permease [Gelria sp. Kuro-4]|uniref:tripartite tricarboxylate transporter permease n=1 Tax=Gelria sp. Kuro-4 TaxID=2796927 RepID=UPI001BF0236F|nr:tripartite tricarboxylate transporter permease [Gelria sp. Kuro-4]BCV25906.1 C4-dicarboxylate ABC transporter permease [Gelria sp. Kuro-4]
MEVTLLQVIKHVLSFQSLAAIAIGVIGGMVVGALPGLTATMGVALLVPVTFGMDPAAGILMLMAIYTSAIYGGSISAILLHTPGTPASAATAIDGYALTQQGKAGTAIRISTYSSMVGGLISSFFLLLLAPPLSMISLKFGPPEYFLLALFGLSVISSLASGSLVKGLISAVFGLLVGTIGVDVNTGFPRFTFGVTSLESGVSLVPAMIGLFSLSQVFIMSETARQEQHRATNEIRDWRFLPPLSEVNAVKNTILRSSIIGVIIGMLPGAGGDIASWVGYNEAKRFSRHPEKFGQGAIEGVAGPEAANNAVTGGALIPLFTLGIPGSATAAVLLGGLMIHGLIPGRELFTKYGEITYTAMVGFILANILMGVAGMLLARYVTYVTQVPARVLAPAIVTLCVIGSFAIGNNMFDVWTMVFFGAVGYLMRRYGFHPAPVVLGLILGPMAELGFRQSLLLAKGSVLSYYLSRPISVILLVLIVASLVSPVVLERRMQTRAGA